MGESERIQRRRRNLAIAGALLVFICLVYAVTILRLGAAASGAGA